jgi:hypothetical protein
MAVADLDRVAARDRWGRALMLVGWIHLAVFGACYGLDLWGNVPDIVYLALWGAELGAVILALRAVAGPGWYRTTALAGIMMRLWITFLILSFNLASLNTLSGREVIWFKPPLASISTFGFMVMAYLIDARFFILAVHMYFTGLLMVTFPRHAFGIYALSWWSALEGLGLVLERRRQWLLGRLPEVIDPLEANGKARPAVRVASDPGGVAGLGRP